MVPGAKAKSFSIRWPKTKTDAGMCLIGFAWKAHPDFPLIVAANRDEFHARATAPSAWWNDAPQVLAGRDLQSGGAWMGITRDGRFAALTNYRDAGEMRANAPSRGALVADFLTGSDTPQPYLVNEAAEAARYNGFNLLAGTLDQLGYFGNRGAAPQVLEPGVYGLSNALLDTSWPKVTRLKAALGAAVGVVNREEPLQSRVSGLMDKLFFTLGDAHIATDTALPRTGVPLERERVLSPAMIVAPVYGTRASTVLCVASDGNVFWEERSLTPTGAVARCVRETFSLNQQNQSFRATR